MKRLRTRQVHLDFHTSEYMPAVGSEFNKDNFQEALKLGHLNSITIFAKCHHSWCYFPTKVGHMHPTLKFDLTGAMIDAAHEIGVNAPVYITVGWSASDAERHPEWVVKKKDGSMNAASYDVNAAPEDIKPNFSWKFMCPNGGYAKHIYEFTTEICERYENLDGLFYDINFGPVCYCDACIKGMISEGLNPENEEDANKYNVLKWQRFEAKCSEILKKKHKDATIFFNGGANIYAPEWTKWQSHFEMEDLPTTWGGYDKMPTRAKYFAKSGKDYLGMTGKFHTAWGEFGGFKNNEALRFECASMLAFGARCSIGDQLHPIGLMDLETYRLIGHAYKYVEEIEPWCYDTIETTKLGIILSGDYRSDEGLSKMLLEKQLDFDIVIDFDKLSDFDVIILPDSVSIDEVEAEKLDAYIKAGGSLILSGKSGLNKGKKDLLIDIGANYQGQSIYQNDYLKLGDRLGDGLIKSPFLCYEGGEEICITDGESLAEKINPYFNRTYGHYCSHQNTPYNTNDTVKCGAVRKSSVIYLAHPIFRMYYEYGAQIHRDYFINALNLLYKSPMAKVKMPSAGRIHFVDQIKEKRYILHLLYASPIQRGKTLVIEDMPSIYNIEASLKVDKVIKKAYLAPQMKEIPFAYANNVLSMVIPEVQCHQIVVLDY